MDFVRRFEDHQVERIRRAVLDYRSKHKVGDVLLTKDILEFLPANVSYDSTLKNVQRLRTGKPMRGATFLNACVQFLEVHMVTPPEEELGLAMKRFVGNVFGYAELWMGLAGDYQLRVLGERNFNFPAAIGQTSKPVLGIPIAPVMQQPKAEIAPIVLSISQGEGMDYGVVRERFNFRNDGAAANDEGEGGGVNMLERKGVCLPVGTQDLLILIRDFMFSHMYVLRRETFGFAGTLIMPSPYGFYIPEVAEGIRQTQYNVVLQRVAEKLGGNKEPADRASGS